jgi:hypothetical protein
MSDLPVCQVSSELVCFIDGEEIKIDEKDYLVEHVW